MASITVNTNISLVTANLRKKLGLLKDKEYLLRPVATELIPLMTDRIHQKGIASDGGPIGTYSKGYMVVRTGAFKNADKFKKGAQQGKQKNAGTFTDRTIRLNKNTGVFTGEDKVGKQRPEYHRSSDTKVVVSLTRQLENDWAVKALPNGYGIGFLNSLNFKKGGWVEEVKKKTIFHLTGTEQEFVTNRIKELVSNALNS
jgi:hypothetical protein